MAFELVDKVKLWGTDTMDPLALRKVEEGYDTDNMIIQTTAEDAKDKKKHATAIKKINKTFKDVKEVKVGFKNEKNPDKKVEEVFDLLPFIQNIGNKTSIMQFDDDIKNLFKR